MLRRRRTAHVNLVERGHIEQRNPLACGLVLLANLLKVTRSLEGAILRARPPRWLAWLEVVDALPAVLLAKYRAEFLQARQEWADAHGSAPFIFVVGIAQ